MSSVTTQHAHPRFEAEASAQPQPKRAIWPFIILLAVNSISLFATLATLASFRWGFEIWVYNYVYPAVWAVMEAQLYLVAFWFSFGGLPKRGRRLLLLALVVCGGVFFGAGVCVIFGTQFSLSSEYYDTFTMLVVMLVGTPLLAVALVWMANAFFVIPAWFIHQEVAFRDSHTAPDLHQRTFGIRQLFSWTTLVALPLGLFNAYIALTSSKISVTANVIPFVIVICCCSPLVAAMLRQKFSIAYIGAAFVWAAIISLVFYFLPDDLFQLHPFWSFGVNTLTVFLNTLALRRMGLCWQPKLEPTVQTDA